MRRFKFIKRIVAFVLVFGIAFGVLAMYEQRYTTIRQDRIKLLTSSIVGQFTDTINHNSYMTRIFAVLIDSDEEKTLTDFSKIASKLISSSPELKALELAPNGVISYLYPYKDNEKARFNLFTDSSSRVQALSAKKTGNVIITEEPLRQGGEGLIIRRPIKKSNAFWGFTIAVVDKDKFLTKNQSFQGLKKGYYSTLTLKSQGKVTILYTNQNTATPKDILTVTTKLEGNSEIGLSIIPKSGWISFEKRIFDITLTLLIATLTYLALLKIIRTREELLLNEEMVGLDALTNALNRRSFEHKLLNLEKNRRQFDVIYLDLDSFKAINDIYGHDIGDKVLIKVTQLIKAVLKDGGTLFRIGGDEFVVIHENDSVKRNSSEFVARIKDSVNQVVPIDDIAISLSISAGLATYPVDSQDIEEVLKLADQRMYDDKKSHRKKREDGFAMEKTVGVFNLTFEGEKGYEK